MGPLAASALAVYAWWVTGLPGFSGAATVAVVGAGIAAMAWGHRHLAPRVAAPRRLSRAGLSVWLVLALGVAAWQLAAYLQSPRAEHPTLSSLTNTALDPRLLRTAALWLWLVVATRLGRR